MACWDIPSKVKDNFLVSPATEKEAQHPGSLAPSSGLVGASSVGPFQSLQGSSKLPGSKQREEEAATEWEGERGEEHGKRADQRARDKMGGERRERKGE